MRRPLIPTFLTRLAAAGLAVVLFSNSPVLAFLTEGRQDNPRGVAAPVQPEADTLRVCGGSGQSFSSSSALVETIPVTGLPNGSAVTAVTVDLNILHGWSGDVVASLGHGSASVGLVNRPGTTNTSFDCDCGCPYDNIAGTFADSATGNADRCVLGVGGVDVANGPYKPIGPGALADFIGSDPNGAWVVTLVDQAVDESGSLPANGVCLNISYDSPLAVVLARFEAVVQDGAVLVSWETVSELDTLGFNVWRSTSPGAPEQQGNAAMIPAQAPGSSAGAIYQWQDAMVEAGTTYFYWLEDVNQAGATALHGPVSATVSTPTAVTLGSLQATSLAPAIPAAVATVAGLAGLMAAAGVAVRRRRAR